MEPPCGHTKRKNWSCRASPDIDGFSVSRNAKGAVSWLYDVLCSVRNHERLSLCLVETDGETFEHDLFPEDEGLEVRVEKFKVLKILATRNADMWTAIDTSRAERESLKTKIAAQAERVLQKLANS